MMQRGRVGGTRAVNDQTGSRRAHDLRFNSHSRPADVMPEFPSNPGYKPPSDLPYTCLENLLFPCAPVQRSIWPRRRQGRKPSVSGCSFSLSHGTLNLCSSRRKWLSKTGKQFGELFYGGSAHVNLLSTASDLGDSFMCLFG